MGQAVELTASLLLRVLFLFGLLLPNRCVGLASKKIPNVGRHDDNFMSLSRIECCYRYKQSLHGPISRRVVRELSTKDF